MATIDIFFFVLILIAAARGYFRGFIAEIMSVAAPLLGLLGGIFLSRPLSRIITPLFRSAGEIVNQIIAFLFIFLVIYLVVFLVQKMIHNLLEKLNLVTADKALGVLLGIVEGLIVVFLVSIVLIIIPLNETRQMTEGSFFRSLFAPFLPDILSAARHPALDGICLKI